MHPRRFAALFLVALAAAVTLGYMAGAAQARPGHGFTLRAARRLVERHDRAVGLPAQISDCRWLTLRKAACDLRWLAVVFTDTPPTLVRWVDVVTRSGGCPTKVVKRTGPYSGVAHGGGGSRLAACFTGPLVVEPVLG